MSQWTQYLFERADGSQILVEFWDDESPTLVEREDSSGIWGIPLDPIRERTGERVTSS